MIIKDWEKANYSKDKELKKDLDKIALKLSKYPKTTHNKK